MGICVLHVFSFKVLWVSESSLYIPCYYFHKKLWCLGQGAEKKQVIDCWGIIFRSWKTSVEEEEEEKKKKKGLLQ